MTYTTHTLANGHTLTLVGIAPLGDGDRERFRVDERNELGTFVRFAYAADTLYEAERWLARAVARSWSTREESHAL